ncbi:DUF5638 domain-containing protein [uncultured Legionella sp.]|uniref:DUF5638 domain-containing protein n=1 Tax=uncultured Legionella sp. TaxID=210934 RepID=UPI002607AB0C|nr:DUF5638 domain-containing protein [uncultured Legionella sp.]
MIQKEFEELDKNYSQIQDLLENEGPDTAINQLVRMVMKENKVQINETALLKQTNKDLASIRNFYCRRFYSASESEKPNILARYKKLYEIVNKVFSGNLTIEHASKMIKATASDWENNIVWDSVIRLCGAVACVIPLAAGIVILPFVLPVIALNFYIGAAILTAASSSIILAISQCYNNLSNIESTAPVKNNSKTELSFLCNMNKVHLSAKAFEPNSQEHDNHAPTLFRR